MSGIRQTNQNGKWVLTCTNSKGNDYYLHGKLVRLKNGHFNTIYYFARHVRPADALEDIPTGRQVAETKNGLPVLKKVTSNQ